MRKIYLFLFACVFYFTANAAITFSNITASINGGAATPVASNGTISACQGSNITIACTVTWENTTSACVGEMELRKGNTQVSGSSTMAIDPSSGTSNFSYTLNSVQTSVNGTYKIWADQICGVNDQSSYNFTIAVTANVTPVVALVALPNGAVCAGTPVTFTATPSNGGVNPTFDFKLGGVSQQNNTTNTYTITPTNNQQISVVMAANNTCQTANSASAGPITMTVNPIPTPSISVNPVSATICSGEPATLTASGGGTYAWSNSGGNSAGATFSPTTSTTYTVTVTLSNCTATASRLVSVNQLPPAAISPGIAEVCSGSSVTLTASGGASYAWNNPTSSGATKTVSPTTATTYTVTVTDANSCSATASRIVTVKALPTVSAGTGVPAFCQGGTSGPLGGSFGGSALGATWSTTSGGAFAGNPNGTTPGSTTWAPPSNFSGTATLKITSYGGGCGADSATKNVTVNPGAEALFTVNDADQCLTGNSFQLDASTSNTLGTITNYGWTFGPPSSSIATGITTTKSFGVSSNNQNILLTVTTNNGCTDTISQTVIIYPMPSANLVSSKGNAGVCQEDTISFFNSGNSVPSNYVWDFGDNRPTQNTNTVNSVNNISYTDYSNPVYNVVVTVTSVAGACAVKDTILLTVHPLPVVNFGINKPNQCNQNDVFQFTDSSTVPLGGIIPNNLYGWRFGDDSIAFSKNTSHSYANVNTYTVTHYATTNKGCLDSLSKTVTVYDNPTAVITANPTNTTICAGEAVTLTANSGFTYAWSNSATAVSIQIPGNETANPATTNYTVTITDNNNCTGVTSQTVTVNPTPAKPIIVNDHNGTYCAGALAQNFKVINIDTVGYAWSTLPTGQQIIGDQAPACRIDMPTAATANFKVIVVAQNQYGCARRDTDVVNITAPAAPTTGVIKNLVSLICTNNTADTYQWGYTDAVTFLDDTLTGETFQDYFAGTVPDVASSGKYYWVIISSGGCENKIYYELPPRGLTGLDETSFASSFNIYPNPFTNDIIIEQSSYTEGLSIAVFDMSGKMLLTKHLDKSTNQLIADAWSAGVYFLRFTNQNGETFTSKVVKQ